MQLFTTDRVGFRINFKHFKDTKPDPSPVDWTFFRMTSLGIAGIWCFSIEERYFAYLGLNSAFYKGQIVDNYIGKNKIASDYGFDFFLGIEHKLNDTWAITNEIGWRFLLLYFDDEPVYDLRGIIFGSSFHYYFGGF